MTRAALLMQTADGKKSRKSHCDKVSLQSTPHLHNTGSSRRNEEVEASAATAVSANGGSDGAD
jgi:hypothetical protein